MKRVLAMFFALFLLLGASACGSDSKSDSSSSETTEAPSSDGGSSSSNADVKAYCDAVTTFAEKAKDAMSDPSKLAGLTDEANDLAKQGSDLAKANLDEADAQAVADCSKKASEALTGG